jgi:ribonucleoside-triphosphate reductase (thioredoxin)
MINKNTRKLMAEAKFYDSYSRYLEEEKRYENWEEAIDRVMNMHEKKYKVELEKSPELKRLFSEVEMAYKNKMFLGAQRALQFGGEQIMKHNSKLYNCTVTYCDRVEVFKEIKYQLLAGSGVGFSVQKQHIIKMPLVKRKNSDKTMMFQIPDSIEGWSDSVQVLMESYMDENSKYFGANILFDYSLIREKGSLITGGFKAPGHKPLKKALETIINLINEQFKDKDIDSFKMEPILAYDIIMFIADAVISGGVRRSATICMFSKDDDKMLNAKTGDWHIKNPQRGRSNNSVMLLRKETSLAEFQHIMKSVKDVGEPGFIFTDDLEYLYNPCVEIGMKPVTKDGRTGFQSCNLTEINGAKSTSKEIFFEQCKVASIMGTLQAGYTDFKYLTKATKEIVEREALIGVGITGIMNNPDILTDVEVLKEGAEEVKKWNKKVAKLIGINQAARTCCVKPSGNASVILECGSGIHGEHSNKYIRHVTFPKDSIIAQSFMKNNPDMCEKNIWASDSVLVAFPIVSPKNSIVKKDLLGVKQLEYVKLVQNSWIEAGTNKEVGVDPYIRHNVSNTITVDNWEEVTNYIYENRDSFCGVSLLAASGDKAYAQAPFTEVLTGQEIINKYGEEVSLFTSALIEVGMKAFNNDLWGAIATALGKGEELNESHDHLLKRDFVRRFNKFSNNFETKEECANCLKDTYNLHKWWRINKNFKTIDWEEELTEKTYTDIDTMGAQACAGGKCEI